VFACVAMTVGVVSVFASTSPALRATRADPASALRSA